MSLGCETFESSNAGKVSEIDERAMPTQPQELADALEQASLNGHDEEEPGPADATGETSVSKAKKRRKKKKPASSDCIALVETPAKQSLSDLNNVLISRSKHLKYISSYHGNWLNLPPGVIDTLLECNEEARVDYRRLASEERRLFQAVLTEMGSEKQAITARAAAKAPSRVEFGKWRDLLSGPTVFDYAVATGQKMPPAVDKASMRNVMEVRRLVDGATDLLTRASSGMTAAELKSMNDPYDSGGGLMSGRDPLSGRSAGISSFRQARLRAMAIGQLAQAFRIDEIATSVILMQVATPFEEAATKVLKSDPTNLDAVYVLYYQERIPSRTLCMSTPPDILDRLVLSYAIEHPHLPAMYRSRGILNLYRQDFAAAIRDFDEGLRVCRVQAARKAQPRVATRSRGGGKKKGKHTKTDSTVMDAEPVDDPQEELFDIGHAPGDDVGRQMLFSRGMTYFMWASDIIEREILGLVDVKVPADGLSNEGGELSLEGAGINIPLGSYGLYDESLGTARRFREAFKSNAALVQRVDELLRQGLRDHERFQAYFPILEVPPGRVSIDAKQDADDIAHAARSSGIDRSISFRGRRLIHARALTGRIKAGEPREDGSNADLRLHTSYHPMLGECIFTQLLSHLLLGDFEEVLRLHYRATRLMAGLDTALDGRPFFLLGRSLSQSEYHEVMERLSHNWVRGIAEYQDLIREIPSSGGLASLAHVMAFFAPEHEKRLFEIYVAHEEESDRVREQTRDVHPEAHRLLSILDGKPANGSSNKPAQPAKQHGYGPQTTARSEIAVTWVLAARIAPLEEQEKLQMKLIKAAEATEGSSSKGKGKARE